MRRTPFIAICLLVLTITSCQDPKEEVISLDEIMPKSERYNGSDSVGNDGKEFDSIQKALNGFKSNGMAVDGLSFISERIFPERFGPKKVEKYALTQADETTNFYRLTFSDSTKTRNAFFNWIDCFGESCTPHFVGEEKNFQKNAFLISMNDTSLFFIESATKVDAKKWFEFLEKQEFEPNWNYIIEQGPRGRAKWYRFEEEKKVKIESTRN